MKKQPAMTIYPIKGSRSKNGKKLQALVLEAFNKYPEVSIMAFQKKHIIIREDIAEEGECLIDIKKSKNDLCKDCVVEVK